MTKIYTLLLAGTSLLLASCRSAEKLYRNGNYDAAVDVAAKKLSKKPNDAELLSILQDAYRFAVNDHEARIRNLSNTTNELKWEQMLAEYNQLQSLHESIRRSPGIYDLVKPTDYSSFVSTYREEATNVRYERGLALLDRQDKQSARDAYYEFQKAGALTPGDIAIRDRMDESFALAVNNVMVLPLVRYGFAYSSYQFDYNSFNEGVLRYLQDHNRDAFVRYYPSTAVQGLRPDMLAEMRFSDVNIGRYRESKDTREVTKRIVSKETVYKQDSVVKEYTTVSARITTTTRTLKAEGIMQAVLRTPDNLRIWSDTYRGDYNWAATFTTFTGDERALTDTDRKLLESREQWPPSDDDIIRIIMNEIQQKVQCGISDYINRRY